MSLVALHSSRDPGVPAGVFLRQSLQRAIDSAPGLVVITVPAPVAPLEALACASEYAVLWDPPSGTRYAGIGKAVELAASGRDRITALVRAAEPLWPRLCCIEHPGVAPARPRLFGGFAFAPGAAQTQVWRDFGDARFVLPTWLYAREPATEESGPEEGVERAALSLTVDTAALAGASNADRASFLARHMAAFERVSGMLEQAARQRADAGAGEGAGMGAEVESATVLETEEMDPAAWRQQIRDIHSAIDAGRCDKIVAARCTMVELSRAADPALVLAALGRRYADCYRFGYRFGPGAMFVGAPPERLIARVGDRVFTEALAGSIATEPGHEQAAAGALLASGKDRSEQDFVVQTIRAVLGPLCKELEVPAEPEIRALRHVLHLKTPITGTLARPAHVLDLVAALHPTPAVGGVPTDAAMAWIAEREPASRGWYAAPVGWFDDSGQGEFAVAIRSGLLCGGRAYLYAGAGIVRGSDPDAEFAETRLKQRAVLDALGVKR
jgi:menaquinone-specific isochorismate synthase